MLTAAFMEALVGERFKKHGDTTEPNSLGKRQSTKVPFIAGLLFAASLGGAMAPQAVSAAHREKMISWGNCALPARTCLRFVTSEPPPTQAEIDDWIGEGGYIIYPDPVTGDPVFLGPPSFSSLDVQDIGL